MNIPQEIVYMAFDLMVDSVSKNNMFKRKDFELQGNDGNYYDVVATNYRDLSITITKQTDRKPEISVDEVPQSIIDIAFNAVELARQWDAYPEDSWNELKDSSGNVWDLNLWTEEDGSQKATLYKVVSGETDTSKFFPLVIEISEEN